MKKIFILTILIVHFGIILFGQTSVSNSNNIIPPSPTAAELGKYGAWPVSYYRGTPNISIPIYNYKVAGYTLPISLSYHASGIKVNDIASWVGLGWSLNAGGVISVSVRGRSDFDTGYPGEEPITRFHIRSRTEIENKIFFTAQEYSQIESRSKDIEPDIYNYSFGEYSGQFVIDNDLKVHFLTNNSGIKISVDIPNKKIVAKDPYGRTYVFDELEYTESLEGKGYYNAKANTMGDLRFSNANNNISAFYLSRIILENNKGSIFFKYDSETSNYYTEINGTMSTTDNAGNNPCSSFPNYDNPLYWREFGEFTFRNLNIKNKGKRLIKIYNNITNSKIEFNSDFSREDVALTKALSNISIFTNSTNTPQIVWDFDYNYFVSPIQKNDNLNNALHKRLRLNSIQKKSGLSINPISEEPYVFSYYGDTESDLQLPYRTSFDGVDFWGYCNSDARYVEHSNPSKIFPSVNYGHSVRYDFVSAHKMYFNDNYPIMSLNCWAPVPAYYGGNKTPNGYFGKSYTIKSIQYPTKGRTEFDFEGHIYSAVNSNTTGENQCGGLRVLSIRDLSYNSPTIERKFKYYGGVINIEPNYIQAFAKACYEPPAAPNANGICYMGIVVGPWVNDVNNTSGTSQANLGGYILSSTSFNPIYSYNSDYIGYKNVEEIIEGNGKNVFYYSTANDASLYNYYSFECGFHSGLGGGTSEVKLSGFIHSPIPVYPFPDHITGPVFKRGLNTKKIFYNKENKPVSEEEFIYKYVQDTIVYGNKLSIQSTCGYYGGFHYITAYEIPCGKSLLQRKLVKKYNVNGVNPIEEEYIYDYNEDTELIKETEQKGSDGKIITTKITYPFNYPDQSTEESNGNRTPIHSVLVEMTQRNMLAYPVEELKLVNGNCVDGSLNTYSNFNGMYLHSNSYNLKKGIANTPYQIFNGRDVDSLYYKTFTIHKYDNLGNVTQTSNENDIDISYIWGYNKIYPIAKAINAKEQEIAYTSFEDYNLTNGGGCYGDEWVCGHGKIHSDNAHTGNLSLENQGSTITTVKTIPAGRYKISLWAKNINGSSGGAITGIPGEPMWPGGNEWQYNERTFTLSSPQNITLNTTDNLLIDDISLYPIDAQIETYTWQIGVGMTSKTDSNGVVNLFEYDGLGRLVYILDYKKNVLKHYKYNYAKEN